MSETIFLPYIMNGTKPPCPTLGVKLNLPAYIMSETKPPYHASWVELRTKPPYHTS